MGLEARHVDVIRVSDEQVVLKRGIRELRVSGAGAARLASAVLDLLDGGNSAEDVIAAFPGETREDALELLRALAGRGMVQEHEPRLARSPADMRAAEFAWHFGLEPDTLAQRLAAARVIVVGDDGMASALRHALAGLGVQPEATAEAPRPGNLSQSVLLCAGSEVAALEFLVELNRVAIAARTPFLPLWIDGMVGHVG